MKALLLFTTLLLAQGLSAQKLSVDYVPAKDDYKTWKHNGAGYYFQDAVSDNITGQWLCNVSKSQVLYMYTMPLSELNIHRALTYKEKNMKGGGYIEDHYMPSYVTDGNVGDIYLACMSGGGNYAFVSKDRTPWAVLMIDGESVNIGWLY
jgi:hypothetical protein